MQQTLEFHEMVKKQVPNAADYALTNAHRRKVVMSTNAREFYHFARMRDDNHAQWDIRGTARNAVELAETVMPLTMMLIGGKDKFQGRYDKVYQK
jgi:thymidylate synthase ThyX